MKRLAWLLIVFLCWIAAGVSARAAERQIASHRGLTASIDSGFGCARRADITVRAPDRGAYTGDRIALQKLLAAARTGLGLECPTLSEIGITGFAGGVPAFQDTIAAASGWKLPAGNGRIVAENPRLPAIAAKTSTCDHDRDQPFVGCWVIIDPPRWQGLILNIKRNGEWFSDRPAKLADGSTDKHGVRILRQPQIGGPDYLQMTDSQGYSISRAGPFFAEECTFMRIDPAAEPIDTWLSLATGSTVEPIFYVRLRAPLKINADILNGSIGPGGFTGDPGSAEIVEGLPDDAFNKCVDNFDEGSVRLFDLALFAVPGFAAVMPQKFLTRALTRARQNPQKYARVLPKLEARAASVAPKISINIGPKISGQMDSRGWTSKSIQDTVRNPSKTVAWRDTRAIGGNKRMNDPATAYYSQSGGYVVRNDYTGDIVQISNRNDPLWKAPWD